MSSSSNALQELFKSRAQAFKKKESEKSFNERVESMFDVLFSRFPSSMAETLRKECNKLKEGTTNPDQLEKIQKYTEFLYNSRPSPKSAKGDDFCTFDKFYETRLKTREEKLDELFEKNRFSMFDDDDTTSRVAWMKEFERIRNDHKEITVEQVEEYIEEIKGIQGIDKSSRFVPRLCPEREQNDTEDVVDLTSGYFSSDFADACSSDYVAAGHDDSMFCAWFVRFVESSQVLGPFFSEQEAFEALDNIDPIRLPYVTTSRD